MTSLWSDCVVVAWCNCAGGNFLEPSGTVYTYCCLSNIFTRVWKIFWETFFGLSGRSELHMLFVDEAFHFQNCVSRHAFGKVRKMPSERCRCIFFSEFLKFRLFFARVWKIVTPKSWVPSSLGFLILHPWGSTSLGWAHFSERSGISSKYCEIHTRDSSEAEVLWKGNKKEWAKGILRIQISRSLICVRCFQLRESPSYLKTRIKLSVLHLILPLQKAFQLLPQMLIFPQLLPSQIFIEILPP